jgi:hypothetical protein
MIFGRNALRPISLLHMHRRFDQIVEDGQVRPQIERLEHHRRLTTQPLNLLCVSGTRRSSWLLIELIRLSMNSHAARIRHFQHIDAAQQCGLARS